MRGSNQERQGAAALSDLFEANYERVVRYIAVRTGSRDLAEDLASEVFLRAVEKIDTFQWRGVPIQAWLFRIAHNLAVDHLRSNSHRKSSPLEDADFVAATDNPEAEVLQTLQREELMKVMETLTPGQREIVSLRFFGGLTSTEAAAVMKRSSGAVRELQSSALKAMRRVMDSKNQGSVEVSLEAEERRP